MREWLKKIRIAKAMSQTEVAAASLISVQFYNYIENGSRRPSPDVAHRIAGVLGFGRAWYRLLETELNNREKKISC